MKKFLSCLLTLASAVLLLSAQNETKLPKGFSAGTLPALAGKREFALNGNLLGGNNLSFMYRINGEQSARRYGFSLNASGSIGTKPARNTSFSSGVSASIGRQKNFHTERLNTYVGVDVSGYYNTSSARAYAQYTDANNYVRISNGGMSFGVAGTPFIGATYPFGKIFAIGAEARAGLAIGATRSVSSTLTKQPNGTSEVVGKPVWQRNLSLSAGTGSAVQIWFSILI